ncbi:hypothetical protein N8Z33_01710 [Flavobacteriaceae bacterium]|nr:hypothetical protein [Flavobacteriaceae bacterium]
MNTLELKKMSLANIEDTLSVSEMEEIMAGSGWDCGLAIAGTVLTTLGAVAITGGWGLLVFIAAKGVGTASIIRSC